MTTPARIQSGPRPYGLRGEWREAINVRRIFELITEMSLARAVDVLWDENINPPSGRDTRWGVSAIQHIIRNPRHAATVDAPLRRRAILALNRRRKR